MEMLEEAGVDLLLHTLVVDVIRKDKRVTGVVIENKSGRQAVTGNVDDRLHRRCGRRRPGRRHFRHGPPGRRLSGLPGFRARQRGYCRDPTPHHGQRKEYAYVMEPLDVPRGLPAAVSGSGGRSRISRSPTKAGTSRAPRAPTAPTLSASCGGSPISGRTSTVSTPPTPLGDARRDRDTEEGLSALAQDARRAPRVQGQHPPAGALDLGVRETRRIRGDYTLTRRTSPRAGGSTTRSRNR